VERFGLNLSLRQRQLESRRRIGLRQFGVLGLLVSTLVGCEARSLYGIELIDVDEDDLGNVVQGSNYSLYLLVGSSPETPGITMSAISNDRPTKPSWDWEEFQSWSPEKRASVFGSFYDQKYRDLRVLHESTCSIRVESFDHRESALELDYGRLPNNIISMHHKGVSVEMPVANCNKRLTRPAGEVEELTVIINSGRGEEAEQVKVRFRIYLVDTSLHWIF